MLHVTKTKTVRKWELNTTDNFMNLRTEDFFVGQCNNIYIICVQYYQKYIQQDMYNAFKR